MNFDINRLAKLAGLPGDEQAGMLQEAGNRSKREDPGLESYLDAEGGEDTLNEDSQADDETLEIDDGELREAVARAEKERLDEARLREAVRGEIQSILEELGVYRSDSSWLYGDDQPENSREGLVNMMFPGIGFK